MRRTTLAAALCLAACAFFAWFPLTDSDIWWHLAAGRWMVAHGEFLRADPFSFTVSAPWVNLHWLFQLAALAVYAVAGGWGLVAVKCVLLAGAVGVVLYAFCGRNRPEYVWGALLAAALLFPVRYLVLARPVVVSLLLLAATCALLERSQATSRRRVLLWLIPLQLVWVNTQPLFVLGPVVSAVYLVGTLVGRGAARAGVTFLSDMPAYREGGWKGLAGVLGAQTAVCLVNPYGWAALMLPLRLYARIDPANGSVFSQNISENVPLLDLFHTAPGSVVLVVCLALAALTLFAFVPRALRPEHVLLFGVLLYLGFSAERNVLLFVFVAAPIAARYLGEVVRTVLPVRAVPWAVRAGGAALAVVIVAEALVHAGVVRTYPLRGGVSPFRFGEQAVDYLARHPVPGNLFNSDRYGGYVLWRLYPPVRVYMDGRFVLRSARVFREYLDAFDHPESFDAIARRDTITYVLTQTAIFERYFPLAEHLYHAAGWELAFADGSTALFVRDSLCVTRPLDLGSERTVADLEQQLAERWRRSPAVRTEAIGYLRHFVQRVRAAAPNRKRPGGG